MDYNDYINKMMAILGNGHTFLRLGLGKTHDRIKSIELNFQKPLLNLVKNKVLRWKFMRPSDRWFPYDHDCMVYPKVIKIIFLFIRFLSDFYLCWDRCSKLVKIIGGLVTHAGKLYDSFAFEIIYRIVLSAPRI